MLIIQLIHQENKQRRIHVHVCYTNGAVIPS